MARFMFLYNGPATPMDEFTEEQSATQLALWNTWMGKIGDALVDTGAPFGARGALVDDGSVAQPTLMQGYSIVEASDLAAATSLAEAHPFLSEGLGRFRMEIFELVPIGM